MGIRSIVSATVVLLAAHTAGAQPIYPHPIVSSRPDVPAGEIMVGLALADFQDVNLRPLCDRLTLPCTSPKTVPDVGLVLGAARNLTETFAVVGETAVYGNVWDSWESVRTTQREINHVRTLIAGPRVATGFIHAAGRSPTDFRLFAQALGGVQVSEVEQNGLLMQPGGGVDFNTRSGLLCRVQADYRLTTARSPRPLSGGRIILALIVPVGSRE